MICEIGEHFESDKDDSIIRRQHRDSLDDGLDGAWVLVEHFVDKNALYVIQITLVVQVDVLLLLFLVDTVHGGAQELVYYLQCTHVVLLKISLVHANLNVGKALA